MAEENGSLTSRTAKFKLRFSIFHIVEFRNFTQKSKYFAFVSFWNLAPQNNNACQNINIGMPYVDQILNIDRASTKR